MLSNSVCCSKFWKTWKSHKFSNKEVDNEGKEKVQKYGLVRKWIGLKSKFYVACEVQVLTTATNQRKKINRYLLKGQRYCNFQIKFSSALWSPARKYLSTRSSVAPRLHIILVVKKRRTIALFFYWLDFEIRWWGWCSHKWWGW